MHEPYIFAEQVAAVGEEMARYHREKASAIVKAIAHLNPDLIRQVMGQGESPKLQSRHSA